uniref:Putative LAGLIDADG homing endonuclease n=1 Tax=Rhexinema sarcinoideum TaxID=43261 RepID=A0A1B2RYV8_9CHLO|nr:putative LAGLIDADG homing endonuclease [Rhexinema sarcinoideum]
MTSSNLFGNFELKALKPQNYEEFGYFLAGLIDADGHIRKNGSVVIAFHLKEKSVACYLKKVIGFGSIYKVKNRQAVTYECMNNAGLLKVANFIRNKLKHASKITQFNERLVKRLKCEKTAYTPSNLTKNHWLAGFLQGDGSFNITQHKRSNKLFLETRIAVKIAQKLKDLLTLIQTDFGGKHLVSAIEQIFFI